MDKLTKTLVTIGSTLLLISLSFACLGSCQYDTVQEPQGSWELVVPKHKTGLLTYIPGLYRVQLEDDTTCYVIADLTDSLECLSGTN